MTGAHTATHVQRLWGSGRDGVVNQPGTSNIYIYIYHTSCCGGTRRRKRQRGERFLTTIVFGVVRRRNAVFGGRERERRC